MKSGYLSLIVFCLSLMRAAAGLSMQDVAAEAYAAGFRGGSLVSAVAAALAESALDPDAVANNVVIVDSAGTIIPGAGGQPQVDVIPTSGRVMLPLNSIHNLSGGRKGKVVSHCRGLWQFNNGIFPQKPTDAQAFDVRSAAACAWLISRHGRDWGKWRVMRNGKAFIEGRYQEAQAVAAAVDPTVVTRSTRRVAGRVTAGFIRSEPGGATLRRFHRGDTGTLTDGPFLAQVKQGKQVSWKQWWRAEWDTGEKGWVSEDLLVATPLEERQQASAVFDGQPHQKYHISRRPALSWTIGGNTIQHRVYLSTDPALPPSSLRWEGRSDTWKATFDLPWRTRHWWRVDSLGIDGKWTAGPVYTFCTEFPPAGYLALQSVTVTPSSAQPGCRLQISGTAFCTARQPVIVGVSLINGATTISDTPHDVSVIIQGTTTFSRVFDIPWTTPPFNAMWTVRVALWQDGDENGALGAADRVLAETSRTIFLTTPLPKIMPVNVNPATMAPGGTATITAQAFAVPGSTLTTARLFRAEGANVPDPGSWAVVSTRTLSPAIGNAGGTITFTDRPPSIRRYWYAINATDNTGRTGPNGAAMFQPDDVLVTIGDNTPPVVTWIAPADGSPLLNGDSLGGTATDNDQIERFEYSFDGEAWQTGFLSGVNFSIIIGSNTSGLNGSHQLRVRATDRSGNVTLTERLYYIHPGTSGLDFDETLDFTGNARPSWWNPNFQGGAGITSEDLRAPDSGDTASLSAFKRPPLNSVQAELGFLCGPEGVDVTWQRQFYSGLAINVRRTGTAQWELQAGQQFPAPAGVMLTVPGGIAPQSITVFAILSNGRMYVRAGRGTAPYEVFAQTTVTLSNLQIANLETCMFSIAGHSRGPAWVDNMSFRAVRTQADRFAMRGFRYFADDVLHLQDIQWTSFPGRGYVIELNSGTGWQDSGYFNHAFGLLSSAMDLEVPYGPRLLVRARQVIP